MIRRPPRSTQGVSSAASDVYKRQVQALFAQEKPVPVYFIGVGEKLEDLETFSAREFAQALLS